MFSLGLSVKFLSFPRNRLSATRRETQISTELPFQQDSNSSKYAQVTFHPKNPKIDPVLPLSKARQGLAMCKTYHAGLFVIVTKRERERDTARPHARSRYDP